MIFFLLTSLYEDVLFCFWSATIINEMKGMKVLLIYESIFAVQEYEGDGIDWTKVEFKDNQECLNLIEKVICSMPSY